MPQYRPLGTVNAPAAWVLPDSVLLEVEATRAIFDGTSATVAFLPTFDVISDAGDVVYSAPVAASIAAGASADVSWFPWRRGLAGGVQPKPPNPIGVLFAWYDFADTSTIVLDGSGKIQSIADKSGQGHDCTQANAAKRPGTTTVNGLNAGLFTHGSSTYLGAAPFSASVAQPLTIALVFTQTIAAGGTYWPGAIGKLTNHTGVWLYTSGGNNQPGIATTSAFIVQVPITAPFTQQLFVGLAAGGSSYLRLNSVPQFGTLAADPVSSILLGTQQDTPAAPGEDDFLNGALCEVLYYQGQLSSSQLAGIEAYLKNKWGTP